MSRFVSNSGSDFQRPISYQPMNENTVKPILWGHSRKPEKLAA